MAENKTVASFTPAVTVDFLFSNETVYLANLTQPLTTTPFMTRGLEFAPNPVASFFFLVISIVGTLGNLLLILSFVLTKKLRCSLNAFITSMAVSDLIFAALYDSLSAHEQSTGGWVFQPELCTGLGVITVLSGCHSLISSALIALNRYILVTKKPSVYKMFFSPVKTSIMIAMAWTVSFLMVTPAAFFGFGEFGYNHATYTCDFVVSNPSTYLYFFSFPGATVAVSNFVCITCYFRIFLTVRKSAKRFKPNQQLKHVPIVPIKVVKETKQMFIIYITFLSTTAPYSMFYAADNGMDDIPPTAFVVAAIIYACNSSLNPIIHTWKNRDYRRAFRAILCFRKRRNTRIQAVPV
ncbi:MTNR1B [Branchiostoma lanceolatum]|uniref:MTNR1B protein n=1 Tax=Branchiostoma lanceolatum TaxID=7740 RepID=A0A8K0ET58_BRALA|nr:MTNR1B [Branchiostoma lanceolatum]